MSCVCFGVDRFKGKKINREVDDLEILEIKTFGFVLEFEISFHQQQHSVAFVQLYSAVTSEVAGTYLS